MLKNKKFLGKIQEQHIRTKSKPLISEVNSTPQQNQIENQPLNSKEVNKLVI